MARIGRPSQLETDPGLTSRIVKRVEDGNYPQVAAGAEGVPERTFYRWFARGEQDWMDGADTPYAGFWQAITRAIYQSEADAVSEARNPVGDGEDGRSDGVRARQVSWFLSTRFRDRWGQTVDVRVRGEAVEHVLDRLRARLDQATYERVLECLADPEGTGAAGEDSAGPVTH